MAFTDFSRQDFSSTVPGVGGQDLSEEERKRRLALLAGEQGFGDIASQYMGNRVDQAQQNIQNAGQLLTNPQQALQERIAGGPVQPEQPQQVQPQPQAPTNVQQPTLPQPGPGVQVAGPTQLPPQSGVNQAPVQATQAPSWTEQVSKIANDEKGLAAYIGNSENSPEGIQFAKKQLQQLWSASQKGAEAETKVNSAVESGNLLPLMKEIKKGGEEGSYIKAYLYSRLGLNDLAKTEQQKLGAGATYSSAFSPTGERALIQYSADGLPMRGFDERGQELKPESLAQFAAGGIGPNTKSFTLPSVHGTPVQRTNTEGQVETGLMMYDPRTQQSYVQVGNTRQPTTGWTTMSQTPQSVYQAAGAQKLGGMAAETGQQQPALAPMAGVPQTQVQQTTVQTAPAQGTGQTTGATQTTPQVTAQASPTGGVRLTPQKTAGGGQVVTQRPGEDYASYQQRKKAAEEQTAANIQAGKELRVAEEKPPAEARGKVEAKDVNNQAFADSSYGLIKNINDEIKKSTGSGIGAGVDVVASKLGASTKGAQSIAKLEVLSYPLLANIPRFEGPQSDYDVQIYRQAAGDFANAKKPVDTRLAALDAMITILKKYDKQGKNDWSFGTGKEGGSKESTSDTGTTSSGNKYKRVQ